MKRKRKKKISKQKKEDKKEKITQKEEAEPVEIDSAFFKLPVIISAVITVIFYLSVLIFVD